MKQAWGPMQWHVLQHQVKPSQQWNSYYTMMNWIKHCLKPNTPLTTTAQSHTPNLAIPTKLITPLTSPTQRNIPCVKHDWINHTSNWHPTDTLHPNPTTFYMFTQQRTDKDIPILNISQCHNCQPNLLDKIKTDILPSCKQMTGHPATSLSNPAPIDINKMIKVLECSIQEMAVNTEPSNLPCLGLL